jgi:hypothetical protein
MLRFCSKSCKKAYEHKLQEERRAKLRHLAFLAPGAQTNIGLGRPNNPERDLLNSRGAGCGGVVQKSNNEERA